MKSRMTYEDWKKLEELLMKVRAGYDVVFDDHNGFAEMVISIHTIDKTLEECFHFVAPFQIKGFFCHFVQTIAPPPSLKILPKHATCAP